MFQHLDGILLKLMNILLDESDPPDLDSGTNLGADTVSHVELDSISNDLERLGEYPSDLDSSVPEPRRYRRIFPRPGFTVTVDDSESPGTGQRSSSASSLSVPTLTGAPSSRL